PISITSGTGIADESLSLSCAPATLPTGVACVFTPNPFANTAGAKVALVLYSNSQSTSLPMDRFPWGKYPLSGSSLIVACSLLMIGRGRLRGKERAVRAIVLATVVLVSLSGCGTSGTFGGATHPSHLTGTYTISIDVVGASPGAPDFNQTLAKVPLQVT